MRAVNSLSAQSGFMFWIRLGKKRLRGAGFCYWLPILVSDTHLLSPAYLLARILPAFPAGCLSIKGGGRGTPFVLKTAGF
jgi:hypothetical protein